jgi:hypothetical protein
MQQVPHNLVLWRQMPKGETIFFYYTSKNTCQPTSTPNILNTGILAIPQIRMPSQ